MSSFFFDPKFAIDNPQQDRCQIYPLLAGPADIDDGVGFGRFVTDSDDIDVFGVMVE